MTAYDRIVKKSKLEGKMEGIMEGKIEGKIEGEIEGIIKGKIETIQKFILKAPGKTDQQIAELFEEPIEFIQQVRATINR